MTLTTEDWRTLRDYWVGLGKNADYLNIPAEIAAQLEQIRMQDMTTLLEFQDVVESSYGGADKTPPDVIDAIKRMYISLQTEPEVRYTQGEWYEVLQSYRVVATVQAAGGPTATPNILQTQIEQHGYNAFDVLAANASGLKVTETHRSLVQELFVSPTVSTETPHDSTNSAEPKWKRKAYFDGTKCGYADCNKDADGYVSGTKPTKGGRKMALWFGPACNSCTKRINDTLLPYTLAELAAQRNGASDLALVLDVEVGDVLKRLALAGIDERGIHLQPPDITPEQRQAQLQVHPVHQARGAAGRNALRDALNMSEFNEPTPQQNYDERAEAVYEASQPRQGQPVQNSRTSVDSYALDRPVACLKCGNSEAFKYVRCPQCGADWPAQPDDKAAALARSGTERVGVEPVLLPVLYLQQHLTYAQGILQQLAPWHINSQIDLDTATTFLAQIKGLWKEIEEKRVEIVRPLQVKVKEIQARFNPPKKLLEDIETVLKQKIAEGVARAEQARQFAYAAAQQALQTGDQHGAALATQQAVAADISLAPTARIQTGIGWEWDASQPLSSEFWSWTPDRAKVQAAIDAGHRYIPGVRIFETSTVVSGSMKSA